MDSNAQNWDRNYPFSYDKLVDYDLSRCLSTKWVSPELGISKGYGELSGLSLVYYGITAYAGIGKDLIFNGDNKSKLLWYVGAGYTISFYGNDLIPHSSVSLGIALSENSHYRNHALTLDVRYIQWVGTERRWGLLGAAGIGMAGVTAGPPQLQFAWNVELGVCFQLRFGNKNYLDLFFE